MDHLFRKHFIRFLIAIAFFMSACVGLWYISSTMHIKILRVVEVKQHLASYEQNKKTFIQETARFKAIASRVSDIEQHRITISNVPNLLSSIEAQAVQEGITLTITSVDAPKKPTDAQELSIDFLASGTSGQIESLVKKLQSQPYEVSFSKFSLYRDVAQNTTALPIVPTGGQWQLLGRLKIVSF
jgi:hypothetical protein